MSNNNPDYNWPTLNRKDLMSLSTINQNDAKFKKFKQLDTNRDWSTNLCSFDIEKSSPKPLYRFTEKPDYINKTDDIDKCSSRVWHFELNKPEYNLYNKDIKGSSPKFEKFQTNRTPQNPLEPKYKLPSYEMLPYDQPKFLRDTLYIKDIDGASPKKAFYYQTRKNENNFSHKKSPIRKDNIPNYNYINYDDIQKQKFKTARNVNPLDPVYDIKFSNEKIGQIEKSKPNELYKIIYADPMNLKTNDIGGAQIGTKNKINKFTNSETNNLIVNDIPGTKVGSLKNCISTNRHVNPVCPEYIMPGHSSLGDEFNPYGNKPKTNNGNVSNCKDENNVKMNNNIDDNKDKEIVDEINQVAKAYLSERKAEKMALSQGAYSYNRSNANSKNASSNLKNLNSCSEKKEKDHINTSKQKRPDNKNKAEITNAKLSQANKKDNNAIYKRIDSNKKVHFEGKENLKENEVIGFNNQIYSVPALHFNPELFKKPPQMYEYVHDKELQPRILERDKKSAINDISKNNEKKSRIQSGKRSEKKRLTEHSIAPSKILHTHNNHVIGKKDNNNNKIDNLNNL